MVDIRLFEDADWPEVWRIVAPVFRAGRTYAVATDISAQAARAMWVDTPTATYVVRDGEGQLVGTYFLQANKPGPGDHVANCGYIVDPEARGQGVATAMCRHSQERAVALGFRAMQYNLVVATNEQAVALWQREGFAIVGTLPGAFCDPDYGDVDAYVMFKTLV
ncbi:GNAT family N-acetyltransferase [Rhodovibrio salinarum]|uniref:N-acetyltransferase n=2 Tax=Rhodovibrio salinarum TaxID=1087 RepID=A0A934QG58_9PROT|nr:GNAT family protein [Rhodovibrio salinarum]MBK1696153.1 N-acetyltransferase [Rhodovibrio salinarum]